VNIRKFFIIVIGSYFLIACGVSPTQKPIAEPEKTAPSAADQKTLQQSVLANIEADYLANQDISARNGALLSMANDYKTSSNCAATNIVIKHIYISLTDLTHLAIANLLKAECALVSLPEKSDLFNKQPLLNLIAQWLDKAYGNGIHNPTTSLNSVLNSTFENTFDLSTRAQIATAYLLAENKQYANALNLLLDAKVAEELVERPKINAHFYNKVWEWFSIIDKSERRRLASDYTILKDYKILLDTIEDTSINDSVRQSTINQWLSTNTNQTLINNLPTQVQHYLAFTHRQNQKIAVLLPLSGRLSEQGQAIKQGVLSAYYDKLTAAKENNIVMMTSIEFIDTGSLSAMKEMVTADLLAPFDTVIGPLLRSHIEQINTFALIEKHQLRLNQTQFINDNNNNLRASFSLSPEQEAQQVVALMRARNIFNPVIIDDGSATTRRMNNAFVAAWEATELSQSNQAISLQQIRYTNNKSMRVGITSALDVLQSQKRIKQLSNISKEKVYSVTRNRRDVDAFVVFARPNDVELINPIIESSISLFTNEQIPVFATSYGYDHKQSKNSQRDLRNLIFVDMPWLLPAGREKDLSRSVDTLFNKPPSAFLRLFAFGYDSLTLVDNLAQLTTFAHLSVNGLSGNLSVDNNHQLTRELSWLSINRNTRP
jgi:outer membrane PBP1 activator LpoA protein